MRKAHHFSMMIVIKVSRKRCTTQMNLKRSRLMNRKNLYQIILILGVILLTKPLRSEIGCMEKSLHLTESFDPKEYHYVEGGDGGYCNCPCSKYRAQAKPLPYGQCPICKHYKAIPSLIVVTEKARTAAAKKITKPISPVAYEGTMSSSTIFKK
jgi:hypothetical protein